MSALADFDGAPGGLGLPTCRTDEDDGFALFSNFGPDESSTGVQSLIAGFGRPQII